jgi:Fic family protein
VLFKCPDLNDAELRAAERVRQLKESLNYIVHVTPKRWQGLLRRSTLARAVRASNSIEGYNVTVDDAIALAEGQEPLDANADAKAAVVGYQKAMTYVIQLANDPHFRYSVDLIRSLHFMMIEYDLTAELMDELNTNDPARPHVARAAMGHLNLAMIHPFSDGNGRMARCLQSLILARSGTLAPQFSSIEEYLGRNTRAYYDVLAEVGGGTWQPERDAHPWIRFCLTAHFQQATDLLRRTRDIDRLWNMLEEKIRTHHLPDRLIFALADAAVGYRVRNGTYRPTAEISEQVASRDLALAVRAGLLIPRGERRGRYYEKSPRLEGIRRSTREKRVAAADPFAL